MQPQHKKNSTAQHNISYHTYALGGLHEEVADALEEEIVVGAEQEVPVESAEPRQLLLLVLDVRNRDDLVEALQLQQQRLHRNEMETTLELANAVKHTGHTPERRGQSGQGR